MAWRKSNLTEYSTKFGKPDVERLGLFIEMPYLQVKYKEPSLKMRGSRRMLAEGPKIKDGWGWCYFDREFKRIFEGEAIPKSKKRKGKKDTKTLVFMPPSAPKKLVGSGDYWGTFGGIIEAVDWRDRKVKKKKVPEKSNPMTNPGKLGGPGYADICFSKWPEHLPEPYPPRPKVSKKGDTHAVIHSQPMITTIFPKAYFDPNPYFDSKNKPGPIYIRPKEPERPDIGDGKWIPVGPAKWQGGNHDGCFEPFPPYTLDIKLRKQKKVAPYSDDRPTFVPQSYGFKTMQTENILGKKVDIAVNATNYKSYEPTYVKYLL